MDMHVALFSMLWIYAVFRYLSERTRRWLFLVTGAMVLAFTAKEVAFIFGAIVGVWLLMELIACRRSEPARAAAAGDLMVLMLGLVLPFSSGAAYLALGWNVRDPHARGLAVVGALVAIGGAIVWGWIRMRGAPARRRRPRRARSGLRLRDWAWSMALFWGFAILLFTTFFTNLRGGLSTGIVGSLGYWLTQHEVARGSQPWFYYLLLAVLYEILPLVAGAIALVAAAVAAASRVVGSGGGRSRRRRDRPESHGQPRAARSWPAHGRPSGAASSRSCCGGRSPPGCAYTWAGEKMPWLVTHLMLPLEIFAGWGIAQAGPGRSVELESGRAGAVRRRRGAAGARARLDRGARVRGRDHRSGGRHHEVGGARSRARRAAGVRGPCRAARRRCGRRAAGSRSASAGLLLALTLRAGIRLCYVDYDLATEHLSYAQGTPDVKRAMREIELMSERSAGDRELFVAYDDQSSWPFVWYLRDYPKSRTWGTQAAVRAGRRRHHHRTQEPRRPPGRWWRTATSSASTG